MALLPGFPASSGLATFQHIRRALAGLFVRSVAGNLRTGLLPWNLDNLVTGKASMAVDVGAFVAVLDRNGAVLVANDGTVTVPISNAPPSGARWSVIYVKQNESELGDAGADGPIIDKKEHTSSLEAARALLPAGALELAYVKVDAGVVTTNAAVISQTAQTATLTGAVLTTKTKAGLDQTNGQIDGSLATVVQRPGALYFSQGGKWGPMHKLIRRIAGTASGSLSGASWLNLAPAQTIPANPFGADVPYEVKVYAVSNATLSGNPYAIRVRVDGTVSAQAQIAGTGGISVDVNASEVITSPNTTHTVDVQILAVSGTATVSSGAAISYFVITLERAETF